MGDIGLIHLKIVGVGDWDRKLKKALEILGYFSLGLFVACMGVWAVAVFFIAAGHLVAGWVAAGALVAAFVCTVICLATRGRGM